MLLVIIARIAMMIALRDGHIDLEEAKIFRSLKVNIPASTKFEDRGIEISGEWKPS